MWLWDINNNNFILGYKTYHSCLTIDFLIRVNMEWLVDQKTHNSKPQEKIYANENKKEG